MSNQEHILAALRKVYDPEIPVNLVDLGLIYKIEINDKVVDIEMTLTAKGCPMKTKISGDVREAVLALDDINDVKVEIIWEPRWSSELITPAGRVALGMENS